jgi:hypothetical protein
VFRSEDPPRLTNIALVLELAVKYQVDALANEYLHFLIRVLPMTFDEFSKTSQSAEDTLLPDLKSVPALIHFVEAANNMRQPFLKRFLPVACWLICLHASMEDIIAITTSKSVSEMLMRGRSKIVAHAVSARFQVFNPCHRGSNCTKSRLMRTLISAMDTDNLGMLALPAVEVMERLKHPSPSALQPLNCCGIDPWDPCRRFGRSCRNSLEWGRIGLVSSASGIKVSGVYRSLVALRACLLCA